MLLVISGLLFGNLLLLLKCIGSENYFQYKFGRTYCLKYTIPNNNYLKILRWKLMILQAFKILSLCP